MYYTEPGKCVCCGKDNIGHLIYPPGRVSGVWSALEVESFIYHFYNIICDMTHMSNYSIPDIPHLRAQPFAELSNLL